MGKLAISNDMFAENIMEANFALDRACFIIVSVEHISMLIFDVDTLNVNCSSVVGINPYKEIEIKRGTLTCQASFKQNILCAEFLELQTCQMGSK